MLLSSGCLLFAQTNIGVVEQAGANQFAETEQLGNTNDVLIQQISDKVQSAWVFQTGELEDEETGEIVAGGENNVSLVDQRYGGNGNMSFLYQYGSNNRAVQVQKGSGNKFNFAGNFPEPISGMGSLPADLVPTQDGDYHILSQYAEGAGNQAWLYQAGRKHDASQSVTGNLNEVWTSQSGLEQTSKMTIIGNRNGSHYLQHGEGKFPHAEGEDESESGPENPGGGHSGSSGGHSDEGGMPDVIPPVHDEDHVFVPTVGVAIKQMGKGSYANMYISGNDNKAVIIQRGGSGGEADEVDCEGGHLVYQDIVGDWNRIFADQRGTGHTSSQIISGNNNLVTAMQKGNGSNSTIDLVGNSNEIGVDQKGKSNSSDIDVTGSFNGNFVDPNAFNIEGDEIFEYGVKIVQEGKGNYSDLDIAGNLNFVAVHQGSGASSVISQTGNWHSATVTQASLEDH